MATTLKVRNGSSNSFNKFWRKHSQDIILPILGLLGFLIIWQLASMTGLIKLPPPSEIITNERTRTYLMYPFLIVVVLIRDYFGRQWQAYNGY